MNNFYIAFWGSLVIANVQMVAERGVWVGLWLVMAFANLILYFFASSPAGESITDKEEAEVENLRQDFDG